MSRPRNFCILCSSEPAVTTICSYRIGAACLARLRAIAADAGVVVDESMLAGRLHTLHKRAFTRAERRLEDNIERREIAAARAVRGGRG